MRTVACEGSIQEGSAAVRGTAPALPAGFPPLGSTSWHSEEAIVLCARLEGHDPLPAALQCSFFTLARSGELYAWRAVRILAPDHLSLFCELEFLSLSLFCAVSAQPCVSISAGSLLVPLMCDFCSWLENFLPLTQELHKDLIPKAVVPLGDWNPGPALRSETGGYDPG